MEIVSKYKVILKHFFFEALKLLWNALFIAATVDHNNCKSDFSNKRIEVPTVVEVTL